MKITPYHQDYLEESQGHRVFFAEYGNPEGEVVLCFHGGPGSKSKPKHTSGFELDRYRVITFDQRGCGKSEPAGETDANTLADIISDVRRLKEHLKVDRWFLSGSSWGATVALAYAQAYPQEVNGLLLGSIFLARRADVAWGFSSNDGVRRMFPDLWEKRQEFFEDFQVTAENAAEILLAKLNASDLQVQKEIAAGVMNWEGNLMNAQADINLIDPTEIEDSDIASTKIFLHYEANHFFLQDNQLLNNIQSIKSIPTIIVHGRYDVLCPVQQAWEVKKSLHHADLLILPTSNHRLTAEGSISKDVAFNYFLYRQTQ